MRRAAAILLGWLALGVAAPAAARQYDDIAIFAQRGDAANVKALLDAGADPNDYHKTYSPLMYAAGSNHVEVVRLLLAGRARVDHRDHNGDRALLWAADRGHAEVVRLLLAAGAAVQSDQDPYRITPLMKAARYGHVAVARILLAAGADAKRRDHTDDTALHAAVLSRSTELVALLLGADADPRAKGKYLDITPLHYAAEYDKPEIARLLVRAGADVEARNSKGRSALWVAADLDHAPVLEALLAAGADPDARDQRGVTPFVAATGKTGAAARLLVERTHDIDRGFAAAMWGRHADLAMRLAERGADVNALDELDRPAPGAVAVHRGTTMLEWLLAHGADLQRHGAAALHGAAGAGRADLVRMLLDANVPVDIRDAAGATALLHAAGAGKVEVVRLLLERGAERNVSDAQGRGIDDYMRVQSGYFVSLIEKRNQSRAYRPTDHLKSSLSELAAGHAEVKALLAR